VPSIINNIINSLQPTFVVKDFGNLNYFLGVEALRCLEEIYLTQCKYIVDLLKRSKMDNVRPCTSLMASNLLVGEGGWRLWRQTTGGWRMAAGR
jgi:hypothetical protein